MRTARERSGGPCGLGGGLGGRLRRTFASLAAALALASSPAAGTDRSEPIGLGPFPEGHPELEAVMERAEAVQALALACEEAECPQLDCGHAQMTLQDLQSLQVYLRALAHYLELSYEMHAEHFESQVEDGIRTTERMGRQQEILAWQSFLHDFGVSMLKVASVMKWAKQVASDPTELAELSPKDVIDELDDAYEALKDMEAGLSKVASGASGGGGDSYSPVGDLTPEEVSGFDRGQLNNMKSTVSDLKEAVERAVDQAERTGNPPNWRRALTEGGAGGALGSIARRYLAAYSASLVEERKQHIDELARDLGATDAAQGDAHARKREVGLHLEAALRALDAVMSAKRAFMRCVSEECGPPTLYNPTVPDFVRTGPTGVQVEERGRAIRWLEKRIARHVYELEALPELVDECPGAEEGSEGTGFVPGSPPGGRPSVLIGSDTPKWCRYDGDDPQDTPLDPIGPGGPIDPGDLPGGLPGPRPGDGPPGGTPSPGDGPGGEPGDRPEEGGGDPSDEDGDEPGRSGGDPSDEPGDDDGDEPGGGPTVTIYVKAKRSVLQGTTTQEPADVGRKQVKLFAESTTDVALPGPNAQKPQTDHAADPIQGTTDEEGNLRLEASPTALGLDPGSPLLQGTPAFAAEVDTSEVESKNLQLAGVSPEEATGLLPQGLQPHVSDVVAVGSDVFVTLTYPVAEKTAVGALVAETPNRIGIEINFCRDKQPGPPDDPYFRGRGSWGQDYDDQWAVKRVGLGEGPESAWRLVGERAAPVTVAVVDTGLDWNHLDLAWDRIWRNEDEVPGNGEDDDGNGYVDDRIGWDFQQDDNTPWDHDGHGTFVAGVIAAAPGNGVGIAGVAPQARIMVLRALGAFGHTRASHIAKAIVYAAENGARVINLSAGGKELSTIERKAIDYAHERGALVVVAAGNAGVDAGGFGPAAHPKALTVASTDRGDARAGFSNFGSAVDLAAPGIEVLSLRARRTDTMRDIPGVEYEPGAAYVGEDRRYYRASGTSFSAPIVTGIAALVLAERPELGPEDLRRVLLQSAEDVGTPGVDRYTGYGLVDARAALRAEPEFFVEAAIEGVRVVREGGLRVEVSGRAEADRFGEAWLEVGAGETPEAWARVEGTLEEAVSGGMLGAIPASELRGAPVWTIRLVVEHESGRRREARFQLEVGG